MDRSLPYSRGRFITYRADEKSAQPIALAESIVLQMTGLLPSQERLFRPKVFFTSLQIFSYLKELQS
jgi:hypothetical protein